MTKHFTSFTAFESYAQHQPADTQYFIRKVHQGELWVQVVHPGWTIAEALAASALGDPSMKCVATGVTEFGITGTCVPRFP